MIITSDLHERGMIDMIKRKGQAMLLTLLALGGTLFGATTIAGILVVYQLRQSADAGNSAKAIFAADAGIEWGLYQLFKDADAPAPTFANEAAFKLTCLPEDDCAATSTTHMTSLGTAKNVARALELSL